MMKRPFLPAVFVAALGAAPALAQDPPFHADVRDNFDRAGSSWADVWGDDDEAYVGRFGQNEVDVFDVSNPNFVSSLATITIPAPNNGASAQDVKVGRSALDPSTVLLFVALEDLLQAGGSEGVAIYDVTFAQSPLLLTTIDAQPGSYSEIHNVSYRDDGWLAICDSRDPTIAIIDLRNYDPSNPPALITSWKYELTGLGSRFVHDITLTDDRLYVSQWDTFMVYDASNLGSSAPSFLGEVRGLSSHAVWPTEDGVFAVTTEEREGGAVRLYEIVDQGGSLSLRQWDSWVNPIDGPFESYSAHNPVILGNRVYVSNYQAGVLALQIDRGTKTLEKVASFDTSTSDADSGFSGAWGVYPFLGHEHVLASDIDEGFWTLDFSALEIVRIDGLPKTVQPFAPEPVRIRINELGDRSLDASSVELLVSVDGGAFQPRNMVQVGPGLVFEGDLPAMTCGSRVDYYFAASSFSGETFTSPAAAPAETHTTYVAEGLTTVFQDNFSQDKGWTVSNSGLSTGGWERVVPVDSGAQPGHDDPDDAGSRCYVTENGSIGGGTGDADVDGGPTRLLSPALNFSGGDGLITFDRWVFNDDADLADGLLVEVSNDGGGSWALVEDVDLQAGGWLESCFRISDFVAPTANVRVRFTISDQPNDSLTEAAVDDFRAERFNCTNPPAMAVLRNGSGINTLCYNSGKVIIGQNWNSIVSHGHHAGATATAIVLYAAPATGPVASGGEILVQLTSPKFFQSTQPSSGTQDIHSHFIPNDPSLVGLFTATQAVIFGGQWEACNAYDLTVGVF